MTNTAKSQHRQDTQCNYSVSPVCYDAEDGYARYTFQIVCPNKTVFKITDRYSSIRSLSELMLSELNSHEVNEVLSEFPRKRIFYNMLPEYLDDRLTELCEYLNTFLNHP